jgi:hypothetical protein
MVDEWLTDEDLQKFLKVSRWTTWRLRKEGHITFHALPSGVLRYRKSDIYQWMGKPELAAAFEERIIQAEEFDDSSNFQPTFLGDGEMLKNSPDTPKRRGRKPGAKNKSVKICLTPDEALDLLLSLCSEEKPSASSTLIKERLRLALKTHLNGVKR